MFWCCGWLSLDLHGGACVELKGLVWRELGAVGVVTGGCGGTSGDFCASGVLHGDLGKRLCMSVW